MTGAAFRKKVTVVMVCLIALGSANSFAADSRKNLLDKLTHEQRSAGWQYVTYSISPKDSNIVMITNTNIRQEKPLTQGQLVNALSFMLTPNIVKRLKNAGFKKGLFVDGHSREYPFVVSTKYYDEMNAWYKSLSGGR